MTDYTPKNADNEHEAQEPIEEMAASLEQIPAEAQLTAIIQSAEYITGQTGLTLEQAIDAFGRYGNPPKIQQELSRLTLEAAQNATKGLSREQWQKLLEAGMAADGYSHLDTAARLSVIEAIRKTPGDMDKIRAVNEAGGTLKIAKDLQMALISLAAAAASEAPEESTDPNTGSAITAAAAQALQDFSKYVESPEFQALKKTVREVREFLDAHREELEAVNEIYRNANAELTDLIPFIRLELAADPELAGVTVEQIFEQIELNGQPSTELAARVLEQARRRREEHEQAEKITNEVEAIAKDLPQITFSATDRLNYPLDKPNSILWNAISDSPNGQISLAVNTGKRGRQKDSIVLVGINFDNPENGVTITKQLTQYDKRVYVAAAALYNAGNKIVSATQIYYMMGYHTAPNDEDKRKIHESLTKMGSARVYIDNKNEVGYEKFTYDASLLPFERKSAYINGKLTESAIHLFREPPLISFARSRNQITTLPVILLDSPQSKTESNLRLEDYLLERISHMKSPKSKAPRKMLYETIFAQCAINKPKERQRAPEKIRKYLNYYKKCGWIKNYTEEEDGITIRL